jgi:hypothetical protein
MTKTIPADVLFQAVAYALDCAAEDLENAGCAADAEIAYDAVRETWKAEKDVRCRLLPARMPWQFREEYRFRMKWDSRFWPYEF